MFGVRLDKIVTQRAENRLTRRNGGAYAILRAVRVQSGNHPYRGGFEIALDARNLPCKIDAGMFAQLAGQVKKARGVDVGIAVHHAIPHEFRVFETGNHTKNAPLIAPFHPRLEAHQAPKCAFLILLSKLDDGIRTPSGARIRQSNRLHGSIGESFCAASGEFFNGNAHLEEDRLLGIVARLKIVERREFRFGNGLPKRHIFVLLEGTIEIIRTRFGSRNAAHHGIGCVGSLFNRLHTRIAFASARRPENLAHIEAVERHGRRDGIIKRERFISCERCDMRSKRIRRKRTCGDNERARRRKFSDLFAHDLDIRMCLQSRRNLSRKRFAVNGEGFSCGDAVLLGNRQNNRTEPPHLLLENTACVGQ